MAVLTFTSPGATDTEMRVNTITFAIDVKRNGEWVSCYQAGFTVSSALCVKVNTTAGSCEVKDNPQLAATRTLYYRCATPGVNEAGLAVDAVFLPGSLFNFGAGGSSGGSSLPAQRVFDVPPDLDNDLLHFELELADDAAFTSIAARIASATGRTGVYIFYGKIFRPYPAEGIGRESYKSKVLVNLAEAGIEAASFARVRWGDGADYTDWRAV